MTENALAVTGPDWAAMDHEHRGLVLADYIAQFGRRTLTEFWIIGRGLEAHATGLNKGDGGWYAYLDQIGMKPAQASELRRLARGFATVEKLLRHRTKDEAVKALKGLKAPESESTPTAEFQRSTKTKPAPVVEPEPGDPPAVEPEVITDAAEPAAPARPTGGWKPIKMVDVDLVDHDQAAREERLERLAIRTEGIDGDVVEGWADKLDTADKRDRDRVQTINAERAGKHKAERKIRDMIDALLLVTPDTALAVVDDVLLRFGGCKRKGAA